MTLDLAADRLLVRTSSPCHRFVLATVRAPRAARGEPRPPVRIAFVLDRSGSMSGGRFELAREALDRALSRLQPSDRFAVVVFDDQIDVVVPEGPATDARRREAMRRMAEIGPRGSTNLFRGWLTGCEQVGTPDPAGVLARCLLLTDGHANVEETSAQVLAGHAEALRGRGVSTSTFGVGEGFDEGLLGRMADAGGGAFHFIGRAEQIPAVVDRELGETLEITARDVVLDIDAPGGGTVEVIGPWPCRREGGAWRVRLPDLVSEQELQIPIRLGFTPRPLGARATVRMILRDRVGALENAAGEVVFEWADDAACDRQPRDRAVDREVAGRYAARAREQAVDLHRAGDLRGAADVLLRVAERVRRYAGSDPVLHQVLGMLEEESAHHLRPMDEMARKERYFAAKSMSVGHAPDGFRKRR